MNQRFTGLKKDDYNFIDASFAYGICNDNDFSIYLEREA
jgi:hypothetical protein